MGHTHTHNHQHEAQGKKLGYSIALNVAITVAQVVGGILSGSLALLSDALHNFSDVFSLAFSLLAHKLSRKRASKTKTFGYKRAELIAAFINALALILVAFVLVYNAINRLLHPETIQSNLVIGMAFLGIIGNGGSVLLLQKEAQHSLNMKSAYLHLLTDMMTSVAVLVGGLVMKYYHWFWVDSMLTLLIACYFIVVGFDLLETTTKMLMLFTPSQIDITALVNEVNKIEGIKNLHHVHVWPLNEQELYLEARLNCSKNFTMTEFTILLTQIETILKEQFHIQQSTIQPEFKPDATQEPIVQD